MPPIDIVSFQPRAWTILSRSFENQRVAGTYLFHGSEGVGSWALAVSFAALLNCEKPGRASSEASLIVPCGECRNCRAVFSLNFEGLSVAVPIPPHKKPDEAIDLTLEYLQAKREEPFAIQTSAKRTGIPISVAREIKKSLSRKASSGTKRVVMFHQMEKMLPQSTDALLKMIEEPPVDTVIILTASCPEALLPTIQSRAQRIKVDRVADAAIERYLAERMAVGPERAALTARLADGSVGQALRMVRGDAEDEESRRAVSFLLFKTLFVDDGATAVARLAEMWNMRDRGAAVELLDAWQSFLRDCAHFAVAGESGDLVNIDLTADLKRLAAYFDEGLAGVLIGRIKNTLADLRLNVHILGALTALALRMTSDIEIAQGRRSSE